MSYEFESISDTIKDHPAETVAVVASVGLIGTIFYYRNKEKKTAAAAAQCKCKTPEVSWFGRYLEYRHARTQLKFAKLAA